MTPGGPSFSPSGASDASGLSPGECRHNQNQFNKQSNVIVLLIKNLAKKKL